ncbi:hypothetical protein GCM10009676_10250 [Prauserella halophila]|uniref:AAA domain-containing protein n=1 Tax=Prauserella halophila TaxID=185641 RepID=A0ABP4GLW0_9PSEU|nr:AAA family ATPase [Prauserella halophila]MCP2235382.1 AAA domain-containing protein [Prauserella halophila]
MSNIDQFAPPPEVDTGDDAEPQPRRLRSQPVREIPLKRRTWLWENRVPLGELTLWVGHAGIGKSQAAVWLASEVSRGSLPGELHGTPSPVLYLGTEDAWSYTLAPRFVAAGADLGRVYRLYAESYAGGDGAVSLAADLGELRDEIKGTGARLVVLDALLSTMTGQDLTRQGNVRGYLEPVSQLAQDLNIAVVGVAHFRKAGGADPLHMIAGSAEFGQVVRSAIGFAADREADDGSAVMSLIKTNIAPQSTTSVRYRIEPATVDTAEGPTDVGRYVPIGETEQNVRNLIDHVPDSADERSERDEAVEWLTSYLRDQGGTAAAADIFKAARADGIAEATLKRARKRAGVGSQRRGFGQGSEWTVDPSGSHSAHSGQGTHADPNGPNGDPNGHTPGRPA